MSCCCTNCCTYDISPPDNYEVETKRKCTNKICLGIFIFAWCFFIGCTIYAAVDQNQDKLWYGIDYNGNVCGERNMTYLNDDGEEIEINCGEKGCKYIYYPRINEDIVLSVSKYAEGVIDKEFMPDMNDINLFGICVPKCPEIADVVCTYGYEKLNGGKVTPNDISKCDTDPSFRKDHQDDCNNCWIVPLNTTSVLYI